MNHKFILSNTDKEKHEEEIAQMMKSIVPIVEDFYKEYGVTVTGFVYDSTKDFHQKSEVTFDVKKNDGFYPSFKFKISRLGSAFRTPSKRMFEGTFFMKGVSKEFINELNINHDISQLIMVKTDDDSYKSKSPSEKIKEIFEKADERLQEWKRFGMANDIFVF